MDMEQIARFFDRDKLAKLLGIELVEVSPGQATTRMTIQEKHYNAVNITHGGAIFTLADFAFAVACNSYGTVAVAVNVNISYLKATSKGTLTARAREISKSKRLGTYHIEVSDETGEIVASFQGTAYRKPDPLPLDGEAASKPA
jgi:acyl-CoA thioesterase